MYHEHVCYDLINQILVEVLKKKTLWSTNIGLFTQKWNRKWHHFKNDICNKNLKFYFN